MCVCACVCLFVVFALRLVFALTWRLPSPMSFFGEFVCLCVLVLFVAVLVVLFALPCGVGLLSLCAALSHYVLSCPFSRCVRVCVVGGLAC